MRAIDVFSGIQSGGLPTTAGLRCGLLMVSMLVGRPEPGQADETRAPDNPPVPVRVDFEQHVAPLLVQRCLECHQTGKASGGLVLASQDGLREGGDSGPPVVPGDVDGSLMLARVKNGEMPPAHQGQAQHLSAQEIAILERWVRQGATWPAGRVLDLYEKTSDRRGGRDWWSLQPLAAVEPPVVGLSNGIQNPIDAFVIAKLQTAGMVPAPPASPRELLRRLHIDLTGLPPTADVLDEFVRDATPAAYQHAVDQLLASPHFGERWARHWLDVARFAETSGYERDQTKPFAWKYRDWVVSAFNSDMPYDQFIREQLAGDEIADRSEQSVVATGFLRLGTWNDEPNDPADDTYERLEDLVHATSTAFLGLTVKCARCHDHKFDPIPQADYYALAAAFWPGPVHARARDLLGGPSEAELGYPGVLGWTDITRTPVPLHVLKNGERAHPLQLAVPGSLSCIPASTRLFVAAASPEARTTGLRLQLADWIASPDNPLTARVIVNRLWQHHFGEGLVRSSGNFGYLGEKPSHPELLDWLAAELVRQNWRLKPLHRLIVTSATWQQSSLHPRHSEYQQQDSANRLLWRAHRRRLDAESLRDAFLVASGQLDPRVGGPSFKPTISPDALEGLSRKASAWEASTPDQQRRRSLYIFTQRSLMPPLMTTFDMCDTTLPCGQRDVTIVAPQALTLLNNEFVHEQAEAVARRVLADADTAELRAALVWRSVLKRDPSSVELRLSLQHIEKQRTRYGAPSDVTSDGTSEGQRVAKDIPPPDVLAWSSLSLVLFNSNEFAWVD